MSIRIEEINVRDLGPLKGEHHFPLDTFNLIYGKNEVGKTFLVEFLLRSLFRSSKGWRLRDFSAEGKVLLSGIHGEPTEFSPDSRDKLEDYLEDAQPGLPLDLAKLLVVRGAELSLVKDKLVDRAILKEYLSSEATLDEIQESISSTVQSAQISDGVIEGSKRGEIKRHKDKKAQLETIDALFRDIGQLYSGGERAGLENRLAEIRAEVKAQLQAKCFKAYQLSQEMIALEAQRIKLPDDIMMQARIDLESYGTKVDEIDSKQKSIAALETASEHYFWIKEATGEYAKREAYMDVPTGGRFQALGWGAIGLTALLLVLTIFNILPDPLGPGLSLLGALASGLFIWLDRRERGKNQKRAADIDELVGIQEDFKYRFGGSMSSLATLEAKKEELQGAHHEKETLQSLIREDQDALSQLGVQVEGALSRLGKAGVCIEDWSEAISTAEGETRELDRKIDQIRIELSGLGVDPSDHVDEDPGVSYQKTTLETLHADERDVDDRLGQTTAALDSLKQRICQETKDDISTTWEVLLENLREHHETIVDEYRSVTAMILGKILVHGELEILREQEDQKIQRSLESPAIVDPLNDITQRYQRVRLEGDRLIISDKVRDFPLNDLSTGAQEQVLLALRIGCAAQVLGKQSLFLVLDDAFQHADWDRRERLMDEVIRLGKKGWQILYLTMDDHIRDLFQDRGEKEFKREFKLHNIEA